MMMMMMMMMYTYALSVSNYCYNACTNHGWPVGRMS